MNKKEHDKRRPGALIETLDVNGQCKPSTDPKQNKKINHWIGYRNKADYEEMNSTGPVAPVDKDGKKMSDLFEQILSQKLHLIDTIVSAHGPEKC